MINISHRTPYGYLMISTTAITILSLALPIMTLQVYDRILPNPGSGTLPVLITGVCLAVFLEMILRLARAYVLEWSAASYEHKMSCHAMQHILRADLSKLGMAGIGENLNRMTAINRIKDFNSGQSFIAKFELVFVPVYIWVTLYVAGPLVIVPVTVLMIFALVSLAMGQDLCRKLCARETNDDNRYDFLISTLDNIHTIKALAIENSVVRKYESLQSPSTRANYDVSACTSRNFNMTTVFSHGMIAAVVIAGAIFVLKGYMTTGALIATILLSGRMMQPVQKAVVLWTRYQDYKIADERLDRIFEEPIHENAMNTNTPAPEVSGKIEITNMFFGFSGQDQKILQGVNLSLPPGQAALISGDHATGKTTLLNLIAGLYPAADGTIEIDGMNIQAHSPIKRSAHIGYIRSKGAIFQGTIRENITCFGQTPEHMAYDVARLLKVDQDVARLPHGFDTPLGASGSDGVPPGLKQRISMVRALAMRPKVILFDNADRHLDLNGYNAVYRLLAQLKGRATLILVSDDQNIMDLADQHFILKDATLTPSSVRPVAPRVEPYRELRII